MGRRHLKDLVDVPNLMIPDVPSADDQLLEIRAPILLDESGASCRREHLPLPAADRAQVQHQEVVVRITQRCSHFSPVSGLLEVVQLLQRDAVVDGPAGFRLEHAVVEVALHVGRKDDVPCSLKGLPDDLGVDVLAHKHLLRIVVQLILRPRLVNHPDGGKLKIRRHQDDVAAHDGVRKEHTNLQLLQRNGEVGEKAGGGGVDDRNLQAQLLEVFLHGSRLWGEDCQRLALLQDPCDVKAEVVRTVPFKTVGEDGADGSTRMGMKRKGAELLRGARKIRRVELSTVQDLQNIVHGLIGELMLQAGPKQLCCTPGCLHDGQRLLDLGAPARLCEGLCRTAVCLTPGDARLRLLAGALAELLHGMQAPGRILQSPSLVALILQGGEDLPGV
mmetsp:Transcript_50330/g.104799  ORF Transcript_50330/g.104799 Transcript_50330/m.104799 type:complete len:389 (+) Transcript_50330:1316-2482(+)